jgi:hypothetical protein
MHAMQPAGMAKPQEVADNVAVLLDMAGRPQGSAATAAAAKVLAPAGKAAADDDVEQQEQLNNSSTISDSVMSDKKSSAGRQEQGGAAGFSADEVAVLAKIRSVLQPVKDVTWPVGLTDNRK